MLFAVATLLTTAVHRPDKPEPIALPADLDQPCSQNLAYVSIEACRTSCAWINHLPCLADDSPKRTRAEAQEGARRVSRSPAVAARRQPSEPPAVAARRQPSESPAPEDPRARLASEAFRKLRLLHSLHRASSQLRWERGPGQSATDVQEERAGRDAILVGCGPRQLQPCQGCSQMLCVARMGIFLHT